ncbi:MAG TPA: hypothetical protein PK794_09630, partial [Armatimonadota bacterium]|nr:hypothetical protein [Armatimonadota bacterium]
MELVRGNTGYRIVLMTALTLALAVPACANAGTLLMWAGMGHLFFGNALVGLFEAFIIARLYGIRYHHAAPWLVLANYLSMAAGMALVMLDAI